VVRRHGLVGVAEEPQQAANAFGGRAVAGREPSGGAVEAGDRLLLIALELARERVARILGPAQPDLAHLQLRVEGLARLEEPGQVIPMLVGGHHDVDESACCFGDVLDRVAQALDRVRLGAEHQAAVDHHVEW
jgi:hypothetical protein